MLWKFWSRYREFVFFLFYSISFTLMFFSPLYFLYFQAIYLRLNIEYANWKIRFLLYRDILSAR